MSIASTQGHHIQTHHAERGMMEPDRHEAFKIECCACGKEPKDAVESPCCGELLCWMCAVHMSATEAERCRVCKNDLPLEAFRPAKAIQAMLSRAKAKSSQRVHYSELTNNTVLPCPENCGQLLTADKIEDHLKICEEVSEPCPNGCEERNLKRKDLPKHIRDDCPLTVVPCKFGCDENLLRREMDDHMQENVMKHLEQLHATVEAQKLRIAELEKAKQTERKPCRFTLRTKRARILGACLYVMVLSWLFSFTLLAKLALCVTVAVGLHKIFVRWVGSLRMPRPFRPVETNILYMMLLLAIGLTVWPIFVLHAHLAH